MLSIIQMPPGIPVATVGVNAAQNAAILAAEMIALADAFFVRFKQSARGGVYAQYLSVVVEEHKPLFTSCR